MVAGSCSKDFSSIALTWFITVGEKLALSIVFYM